MERMQKQKFSDNKSIREAIRMLADRADQALRGLAMPHDLLFGLTTLLEADGMRDVSAGKRGILEDLRHKLERVEGEHSPETIKELSDALLAYLDDELAEKPDEKATNDTQKEKSMAKKKESETVAESASLTTALEAKKGEKPGDAAVDVEPDNDEDDVKQEAVKKDGDLGEPKGDMKCEACGASMKGKKENAAPVKTDVEKDDDEDEELPPVLESAAPDKMNLQEANEAKKDEEEESMKEAITVLQAQVADLTSRLQEARGPMEKGKFTEADRRELNDLRERVGKSELRSRANKELRKADLLGVYEAKELMEFTESQWPSIIKTWSNAMPPQRFDMPRVTDEASASRKAPATGTEFFESFYQNAE